jgi:ATP-dependent RNA helicase RhlE
MDDKRFFLQRIIQENEDKKILVFVRTKVRAERVKKAMARAMIDTLTIHGDKEQQDRDLSLLAFQTGACSILIATDVTARGIDIEGVDMVVNYDLPEIPENYVHRVGRTGRGRNRGKAISFCAKEEEDYLSAIEEFITVPITRASVTKREYNETIEDADDGANNWKQLIEQSSLKPNKKSKRSSK